VSALASGCPLPASQQVTLIMPVCNGGRNFARCLEALAGLSPQPGEIIVVDDGSKDGSLTLAQHSGACVLQTARPRSGPAIARNLAAAQARGQILFFVDSDVRPAPDAIARVVAEFQAEPELAALYGSYDESPPAQNFVSQYKNLLHHFVHQDSSSEGTSFWAGCGAIRSDVFRRVGGFNAAYRRPSIEDIELGYRLRNAGYRTRLVKSLQASHLKHWTLRTLVESDVRDRALPWTRLILRESAMPADLNLKWPHRASVLCACVSALALACVPFFPIAIALAAFCAGALLVLNGRLYAFFAARRGLRFALAAIPLHWFYYIYSGLALALGILVWLVAVPRRA
jgi:glycosyltransferase involved in cell wall biosynthesis